MRKGATHAFYATPSACASLTHYALLAAVHNWIDMPIPRPYTKVDAGATVRRGPPGRSTTFNRRPSEADKVGAEPHHARDDTVSPALPRAGFFCARGRVQIMQ